MFFSLDETVYSTVKGHEGFGTVLDVVWNEVNPGAGVIDHYRVQNDITEEIHTAHEHELRKVKITRIGNLGDRDTQTYECPEQTNHLPRVRQRDDTAIKPHYLTTAQVASAYQVNPSTVRRWCMSGKVKAHKVGRAWLIESNIPNLIRQGWRVRKTQETEYYVIVSPNEDRCGTTPFPSLEESLLAGYGYVDIPIVIKR